MLNVLLYLIALITGMLAFSGLAGPAMMTLFQFSLLALVGSLLTRGFTRGVALY